MAYEICKDCIDQDDCYIWHAFDGLVKELHGGCPFKVTDVEEGKKIIRYELIHDGKIVHTLTTKDADADIHMINFMIKLSDKNQGKFSIYSVDLDPETGNEKYTWVASTKGGVEI